MGRETAVPVASAKASRLRRPAGSPMLLATYGDRRSIPAGIRSQEDIADPRADTVIPRFRRAAVATIPYGPAPTIAMSATPEHPPRRTRWAPVELAAGPSVSETAQLDQGPEPCRHQHSEPLARVQVRRIVGS